MMFEAAADLFQDEKGEKLVIWRRHFSIFVTTIRELRIICED